ncbi:LOW QUALITY PROTEIN: occludin/ELL domain-containing protein 1 [Pituophis catenifer annectens]|uniref:LOW QUALITY PROTEIN: occludin/ELL domain-containing protein 1 n=1 Tax=Pituophis catenifer annectens TaxID=94852 RepID=UPI0039910CF1
MLGSTIEKPFSAGAERQPLGGLGADPWLPSSPLHPGPPRTPSSGWSSWSGSPAASPQGPPHRSAQPAFPDGPPDPEVPSLKPIRRFFPPSWKNTFGRWSREEPSPLAPSSALPNSPPANPGLEGPERTSLAGEDGSTSSEKKDEEDGKEPASDATTSSKSGKSMTVTSHGGASAAPLGYEEKLEAYDRKYSYLKSWPGLLRLLGGLELILGGMAFACTAAYIQKDYQWSQLYGNSFTGTDYGYYVPMTPFVLVVASLVWLLTVILLALGVTMHYRTILLNSHWWPLAEFALNLSMFLLYLAAAIAYVHDINRGGLCYSAFAYGPLITSLCQVEGGQVAALTFLFLAPLLYLTGSLVCLKMWRHEAARRMLLPLKPILLPGASPQHLRTPQAQGRPAGRGSRRVVFYEEGGPEVLNSAIPVGHNPRPLIVPDYIVRYPAIGSPAEREKYTAIFKDQYPEYQALVREIHATRQRFKELDALMSRLPAHPQNKEEQSRVSAVWRAYRGKKKDPSFLEKQERCDYLRRKLSHLKAQIQTFDADRSQSSVTL